MTTRLKGLLPYFASLPVGAVLAFGLYFNNRVYPQVSVVGTSLSGMTTDQASQVLRDKFPNPTKIDLSFGTSQYHIQASQIQFTYLYTDTANEALNTRQFSAQIPLSFSISENDLMAAIASISGQINIPAQDPQISLQNGQVNVSPGNEGQEVDERKLLAQIRSRLSEYKLNQPIEIPILHLNPKLSQLEAENLKNRAEKMLNKRLILTAPDNQWVIPPEQVISWMDPTANQQWQQNQIESWVSGIAQNLDRPAQNAFFQFLGSNRVQEFKPAVAGVVVDQKATADLIYNSLSQLESGNLPEMSISVVENSLEPTIKTSQVNSLGIKELIGEGVSDFSGSIPNRVFNVAKAANNMNGILVAPGEIFSFNQYVGDISSAGGYKQAYVIKEGKTVLGDGGGVCQVSSTLFRAALNTGLPIIERTGHAYRVHYYENGSQPGLDATIFTPSVDFKFQNDTAHYILIQSRIEGSKLYFDLYGTSDGRVATVSKTRVWDVAPPPPDLYQDDPTLAKGIVKQVDFSAWGAKTAFDYKVVRGDEVLQNRTFYTNYSPWQAIYLRGTL